MTIRKVKGGWKLGTSEKLSKTRKEVEERWKAIRIEQAKKLR